MAIKVDTLSEYVNVHKDELLTKAVLGANTLDHVEKMLDVKYKDQLNYLDSTVVLADGTVCGWNPQGDDKFTARTIEVVPLAVQKEFCWKDLRKYWMNEQLLFDAGRETLPFEEKFTENNIKAINAELEKQIWMNEKGTDNALFDGFVKLITAAAGSHKVDLAAGYTAIDIIDKTYAALTPVMLLQGVTIFVSHSTFRNYIQALNAVCCANRAVIDANADSVMYPGDSRVKIVPVTGLEGAAATKVLAVASPESNLVYATDVDGSENDFRLWFDEKESKYLMSVLFNAGVQYKFDDQLVITKAQG